MPSVAALRIGALAAYAVLGVGVVAAAVHDAPPPPEAEAEVDVAGEAACRGVRQSTLCDEMVALASTVTAAGPVEVEELAGGRLRVTSTLSVPLASDDPLVEVLRAAGDRTACPTTTVPTTAPAAPTTLALELSPVTSFDELVGQPAGDATVVGLDAPTADGTSAGIAPTCGAPGVVEVSLLPFLDGGGTATLNETVVDGSPVVELVLTSLA